ncbi:MAG: sorbosone dehydrogenase family protein [Chromatiales bacterium]|nr:sorbosone dehydrogenase family protein [Chromatiales bacterium]
MTLSQAVSGAENLTKLSLPKGFQISYFAQGIENARSMAMGTRGTIFVGTRSLGKVYALVDEDKDGQADKRYVIAEGLRMPNGIAFHQGALYVAENHRILRFTGIERRLNNPPEPKVIAKLPRHTQHGWRYMRIGPDGHLYVAIGAPCNVCDAEGFATIERMRTDGSERHVYARGVRNSVGFDWHPVSGDFWFTDNGRDWLGDDMPPDELNRAAHSGQHFGYPYCHGGDIPDPEYGHERHCDQFVAPVQKLDPHVAALGMRFYTGKQFPETYRSKLFIAEHGSWNRTVPIGYRISLVQLEGNKAVSYRPFIDGWLGARHRVSGRPVDLLVMPDGSMLISDDYAGVIYRVSYQP